MVFGEVIIREYEIEANKKLALICRIITLLLIVVGVLNFTGVFIISPVIYPVLGVSGVVMLLPTLFYKILHKHNLWIRYFVLTCMVLMSGMLYAFLSYHVIIMLVFPVVVSCLYCDKKSTLFTSVLGIPVLVISHLVAYKLKVVADEPLVTLYGVVVYGIVPRILEYMAFAVCSLSMTGKVQKLIQSLVEKNRELYQEQESIINSLSYMIESQSKETGQHVKRVSEYTMVLCEGLGMEKEQVWKIGLASQMHDAGKIFVPIDILEKPGRLTNEEFEIIKKHTKNGKKLLEKSPGEIMQLSSVIAYEHHERYDGRGYAGMKGEEISVYARCVSVADVFDALVSWRPYKKPWTPEEARKEILANAGTQFDPAVVKIFDDNFDKIMEIFRKYPDSTEEVETGWL